MSCDYTILGVRQTTTLSPFGGYVPAQEVSFSMPGVALQKITIPQTEFTPERVKAEIERQCGNLSAILNINK